MQLLVAWQFYHTCAYCLAVISHRCLLPGSPDRQLPAHCMPGSLAPITGESKIGSVSYLILFILKQNCMMLIHCNRNQLRGASKPAFVRIQYSISPTLYSIKIKVSYATTGTKSAKSLWFICSPQFRSLQSCFPACLSGSIW